MTGTVRKKHETALEGFRLPMPVTEVCRFRNGDAYPICPHCRVTVAREFQAYCDRCGQCLDWDGYPDAVVVLRD